MSCHRLKRGDLRKIHVTVGPRSAVTGHTPSHWNGHYSGTEALHEKGQNTNELGINVVKFSAALNLGAAKGLLGLGPFSPFKAGGVKHPLFKRCVLFMFS